MQLENCSTVLVPLGSNISVSGAVQKVPVLCNEAAWVSSSIAPALTSGKCCIARVRRHRASVQESYGVGCRVVRTPHISPLLRAVT